MGLYARVDLSPLLEQADKVVEDINSLMIEVFTSYMTEIEEAEEEHEDEYSWIPDSEVGYSDDGISTISSIDISSECNEITNVFSETFMSSIGELTPVRTGYLVSSIYTDNSEIEVECYAGADYAQYVEYGTYKMNAQPYFEPSIEAGIQAVKIAGESAIYKMNETLCDELQIAFDDTIMGIEFGTIYAFIVFIMLFAILDLLFMYCQYLFYEAMFPALEEVCSNVDIYVI